MSKNNKKLGLFGFFALTATMVMSVHEYPTFAIAGMQIPFFLLITGFLWFLPLALCSAEMATVKGWEEGGIFTWVSKMLGKRLGFAAVFFQWFQITVCFIIIIYFMLGALSYLIGIPAIQDNPFVKCICTLVIFWILSLIQLGGTSKTADFARVGFILGVIVPTVLLVILGVFYILQGKPLHFKTEPVSFLPDFTQTSTLVVLVSFLFANMGAEASASHINEMSNPKRNYPLAMLLLVILATVLNAIGGFTVAGIVPLDQLSLSAGMVQTYEGLILSIDQGLVWLVKIICILLIVGVIGEVGSWIVGPSRALYTTAQRGLLPKRLLGLNKNGVPTRIIVIQGFIVSLWAVVLTFGGGGNNLSFITAISLTTIIYLISYTLIFISYMKLARHPEYQRSFHVPFGRAGKIITPLCGLVSSVFALCIAFFPPSILTADQAPSYGLLLTISFTITLLLPLIIYQLYGKKHTYLPIKPTHMLAEDVNRFTRLSGRGEHLFASEQDHSLSDSKKETPP